MLSFVSLPEQHEYPSLNARSPQQTVSNETGSVPQQVCFFGLNFFVSPWPFRQQRNFSVRSYIIDSPFSRQQNDLAFSNGTPWQQLNFLALIIFPPQQRLFLLEYVVDLPVSLSVQQCFPFRFEYKTVPQHTPTSFSKTNPVPHPFNFENDRGIFRFWG